MAASAERWERADVRGWERRAAVSAPPVVTDIADKAPPLGWLRGRLLDLSHLSPVGRLLAFLYYRVCRQPPALRAEPGGEVKVMDLRCLYGSRERACRDVEDGDDFLLSVPYERTFGSRVAESATFCRPKHPAYGEQDRCDRLLYRDDLAERLSAETRARLRDIEARLKSMAENA